MESLEWMLSCSFKNLVSWNDNSTPTEKYCAVYVTSHRIHTYICILRLLLFNVQIKVVRWPSFEFWSTSHSCWVFDGRSTSPWNSVYLVEFMLNFPIRMSFIWFGNASIIIFFFWYPAAASSHITFVNLNDSPSYCRCYCCCHSTLALFISYDFFVLRRSILFLRFFLCSKTSSYTFFRFKIQMRVTFLKKI